MVQGRGLGGTDGSGSGNRKLFWRNVDYWMMEATKSQGITNVVEEKRVMLGVEAERVEISSALKSRTGDRQSVVRDKLEVFM